MLLFCFTPSLIFLFSAAWFKSLLRLCCVLYLVLLFSGLKQHQNALEPTTTRFYLATRLSAPPVLGARTFRPESDVHQSRRPCMFDSKIVRAIQAVWRGSVFTLSSRWPWIKPWASWASCKGLVWRLYEDNQEELIVRWVLGLSEANPPQVLRSWPGICQVVQSLCRSQSSGEW